MISEGCGLSRLRLGGWARVTMLIVLLMGGSALMAQEADDPCGKPTDKKDPEAAR
ncbi:MAG: hypothetical protein IPJ85_12645 [Flavobacteriales bacterium]|nr:hypothetical protein [Flavobacteriales bacterium]